MIFYGLTGVVLYVFFLFVTFPFDAIKQKVLGELEKQTGGKYSFSVDELNMSMFGNLILRKVQVLDKSNNNNLVFLSTKVKINPALLAILFGHPKASIYALADKGAIDVDFDQDGETTELAAELDELSLTNLQFLKSSGITYNGQLNGELQLTLNQKSPNKNNGNIKIDLQNLFINQADALQLKLMGLNEVIDLPKIQLSQKKGSKLNLKMDGGKISLGELTLQGGDLEVKLSGDIQLGNVGNHRLNINGEIKLAAKLEDLIFNLVKKKIGDSIDLKAILSQKKNAQGFVTLNIAGTTKRPDIKIADFPLQF